MQPSSFPSGFSAGLPPRRAVPPGSNHPGLPWVTDRIEVLCTGECFDVQDLVFEAQAPGEPGSAGIRLPTHTRRRRSQHDLARRLYSTELRQWQTRLIRLHDGRASHPLVMDLVTVNLFGSDGMVLEDQETVVQYEALSYAWGSSDCSNPITCNGWEYLITDSLDTALKELRHSKAGLYLWADALCINQHDNNEKSRQVREMLNIYRRASNVIVWLGSKNSSSDLAIIYIYMVKELRAAVRATTNHAEVCVIRLAAMRQTLLELYGRPWTQRTWVRQEIYAARRLTVLCGSEQAEVEWTSFDEGCLLLWDIENQLTTQGALTTQQMQSTECLTRIRELSAGARTSQKLIPSGPRDIFEVLMLSPFFEATDPKDFIYSTLGMASIPTDTAGNVRPDLSVKIQIDYSKTTSQVYQDMVRLIVALDRTPESLAKIFHYYVKKTDRPEGLPTWTMDWKALCCSSGDRRIIERLPNLDKMPIPIYFDISHDPLRYWPSYFPSRSVTTSVQFPKGRFPVAFPELQDESLDGGYGRLGITGRIANVIDAVTDFTCELGSFIDLASAATFLRSGERDDIQYHRSASSNSTASYRIFDHSPEQRRKNPFLPEPLREFASPDNKPKLIVTPLDRARHDRRLAVLAAPTEKYVVLVPVTAKPGDLLVGIDHDVLPLVLRAVGATQRDVPCPIEDATPSEPAKSTSKLSTWLRGRAPDKNEESRKNRALLQQMGNRHKSVGGLYEFHGVAFHHTDDTDFIIRNKEQWGQPWAMAESQFVLI